MMKSQKKVKKKISSDLINLLDGDDGDKKESDSILYP